MFDIYPIGWLPTVPNDDSTALLKLVYQPVEKRGVWHYGDNQISLAFSQKKTTLVYENPPQRTVSKKLEASTEIPCEGWVDRFGRWIFEPDCIYRSSGKILWETETEREWLSCSGFNFDEAAGEWSCLWHYRHLHNFFNSAHKYDIQIELRLNFITLSGFYSEQDYADTLG